MALWINLVRDIYKLTLYDNVPYNVAVHLVVMVFSYFPFFQQQLYKLCTTSVTKSNYCNEYIFCWFYFFFTHINQQISCKGCQSQMHLTFLMLITVNTFWQSIKWNIQQVSVKILSLISGSRTFWDFREYFLLRFWYINSLFI